MNNVFDGFSVDLSFIRKILKEIERKLKNNKLENGYIFEINLRVYVEV